ncbi:MAG: metallophosphoesterase [Lutimonas sp.]
MLAILFAMDAYVFYALRKSIDQSKSKTWLKGLYLGCVSAGYVGFYYLYTYYTDKPLHPEFLPNLFVGFFFSFLVFKLLLIVFFLAEDILRMFSFLFQMSKNLVLGKGQKTAMPGRRKFIRQTGLFLAAIPFSSMLYGVARGKYDFRVNRMKLHFDNLPESFEGFRMVHISDIHSGSFDREEAIRRGIQLINEEKPDLICFTGDLVNNDSREIQPYIEDFKKLNTTHGVYSTLGNHDYGDYKSWDSPEAKEKNMELLFHYQEEMGFKLLNNQHAIIEKNGQRIGIYGVENWGNRPFPQRGDIDSALKGAEDLSFKVLMSHDPTHWEKKILKHPTHFDLTLAGHTHGMQFGVEIPGFKWSPIKYIYPQWAGLYEKASQLLYVNRGFGFLGFPGRVGIWPEITVFELHRTLV